MAAPTLTDAERAQLESEKEKQEAAAQAFSNQIAGKQARAAELQLADDGFKKFFSYYNDDIIGQYDAERQALVGTFVVDPIVENDVVQCAQVNPSHRTTPTLPDTDIVRISQFDGTPTSVNSNNEQQHISDQADIEDGLQNGYSAGSGFTPATAETTTSLDSSSTDVTVEDATNPLTIQVGDIIAFEGTSEVAIAEITSVTDNMGGDPPYNFTYGISYIVAPSGTIASAASLADFNGFTDSERDTKTATDPIYQNVLDSLVNQLETEINNRIARLDEQITAIQANEDPDASTELSDAETDANTSKTFLQNYLVTTDVSDTGLSSLSSERSTRGSEITTRVSQINANYTGQTENYYDRRYTLANDRANTSRGVLRLKFATDDSASTAQQYSDQAQDAADGIGSLLS